MKLEYGSKTLEYDASGKASHTKVILTNGDGASYPVFLEAEKIELSNAELLDLALDSIYQENFPMKAENEKFNLFEEKMTQVDDALERLEKQSQKIETLIKTTTGTVNELIASVMGGMEDEEFTE